MTTHIHYTKPSITDLEVEYAGDAARHGWGSRCYEYIEKFESAFKQHLGVKHAIATSSCTGALHMGLSGLGIGPGDEVILADINWIASAAPITYVGATPVLVDIDPSSWCVDPKRVEEAITPNTKAIIAVHLYGNLCDMEALLAIGERYGIAVIEDAAEAIGSQYHGRRAGSMGAFGAFSFHGTKTITTGEGGMFVTDSDALYEKVLTLSNHGRMKNQTKQFWPDEIGYKYKMSNIQAAIGLAQVERVDELIASKRRVFESYRSALHGLPVLMNPEPENTVNGYWMPTIVVEERLNFDRSELLALFKSNGIDARVFFWPLSDTGHFVECRETPVGHAIYDRGINLPSYHELDGTDTARIAACISDYLSTG